MLIQKEKHNYKESFSVEKYELVIVEHVSVLFRRDDENGFNGLQQVQK